MPPIPLRLKVEINTREPFCMYGLKQVPYIVASRLIGRLPGDACKRNL